jgi:hypothetical protein
MSTILKALRRLDQEKARDADRCVRDQVSDAVPGEPFVRR